MSPPLPTPNGLESARTVAARLWSDPPAVEDKIAAEIRARDAQWNRLLAAEREARAEAEAEVARMREALVGARRHLDAWERQAGPGHPLSGEVGAALAVVYAALFAPIAKEPPR